MEIKEEGRRREMLTISLEGLKVVGAVREMVFVDARQYGVSIGEAADYLRCIGDMMDPDVCEEGVRLGRRVGQWWAFDVEELEGLREEMGFEEKDVEGHVKVLLELGYLVEV